MRVFVKTCLLSAVAGLLWCFDTGCISGPDLNASTDQVKYVSQDDFAGVVNAAPKTVVDFYATWCGPCRKLSPMLDKLAAAYTNNVKFVKVNIDQSADLIKKYSVDEFPTVLFFKNGQLADKIVGLPEEKDLKARLDAFSAAN